MIYDASVLICRYLFLEVLSDADRDRTHVFSSFFYRRLTQRQTRSATNEDTANKTCVSTEVLVFVIVSDLECKLKLLGK